MLQGWQGVAFNQSPDSANQIHGDEMAKQYGFQGGLVPGVTVSSYLIHPAVVHWGEDWLNRGKAHVRVLSPLYDEETFEVRLLASRDESYDAELYRPNGTLSATASVSLAGERSAAPARRFDELVEPGFVPPVSSLEVFQQLQQDGCKAFSYHWGRRHNMMTYLREPGGMPEVLQAGGGGYANMAYLLGCGNWILAGNVYMNPWVHLETRSENFRAVPAGTDLVVEMAVVECFEKKGHQFVDIEVNLFDEADSTCVTSIEQRAIYRLRGAAEPALPEVLSET